MGTKLNSSPATEVSVGVDEQQLDYDALYSSLSGASTSDIRQCTLCHALVINPSSSEQDMHWGFHLRMMQLHDDATERKEKKC